LALGLLLAAATGGLAQPVAPQLSPKLREALQEEMRLLLGASQDILAAIVMGDHDMVASQSERIVASFILAQALSEEELRAMEEALPPAFIERDEAFHATAAELAEAGRGHDTGREAMLFGRLVESCTVCHARFAADRFPELTSP
jgi:hypothetical protein